MRRQGDGETRGQGDGKSAGATSAGKAMEKHGRARMRQWDGVTFVSIREISAIRGCKLVVLLERNGYVS